MALQFQIQKRLSGFELDAEGAFDSPCVGVFGPSGSGKSTLLNCLSGFIRPDSGEIQVDGREVFSTVHRIDQGIGRRPFGTVFQEGLLFPHLTVRQNILYGAGKKEKKKWDEMVEVLNLYGLMDRAPGQLSGGERQRVAIARTLMRGPSILLMDEPVSSLDTRSRWQILGYVRRVHRHYGIPLVYVSHAISEMVYLADKVFVMEGGRLTVSGHPLELLDRPSVWSGERGQELENIWDLPVRQRNEGERTAVVDMGGRALTVACDDQQVRPFLRVGLRAKDIILAVRSPEGLSVRNIIPGTIRRIIPQSGAVIVSVAVGDVPCLVEITASAALELGLAVGQDVFLIIKARSTMVLN